MNIMSWNWKLKYQKSKWYSKSVLPITSSIHTSSERVKCKFLDDIIKRGREIRLGLYVQKSLRVIYFGTGMPKLSIAILTHDVKLHSDTVVCPRIWKKCKKYLYEYKRLSLSLRSKTFEYILITIPSSPINNKKVHFFLRFWINMPSALVTSFHLWPSAQLFCHSYSLVFFMGNWPDPLFVDC